MPSYYFYLPEGLSAATEYYVDTIRQALLRRGDNVIYTAKIKDIPLYSNIVAIRAIDHMTALIRQPRTTIVWYQGVAPYEVELIFKGTFQSKAKKWIHTLSEKVSLNKVTLPIFVSEAMMRHYTTSYNCTFGHNYYIMPCFNMDIMSECFTVSRYEKPRFLYAGSLGAWEDINGLMDIFCRIKSIIPSAELAIFTNYPKEAGKLLEYHHLNGEVDSLTPKELQKRMTEFKYGLMVRKPSIINDVATPTKINSYMSSGLIPVYSDVVSDYRTKIAKENPYVISFKSREECIREITRFESTQIIPEEIKKAHTNTFNSYWNREKYINELTKILP